MTCLQSLAWLWWGGGIRRVYSVIPHYGRRCSTLAARRQRVKRYKGTSHPAGGGCLHCGGEVTPSIHTMEKLGAGGRAGGHADFGWVHTRWRQRSCLVLWRQGRAAGPSPAHSGAFLLRSWKLNGFASGGENSPLGTRVTTLQTTAQQRGA